MTLNGSNFTDEFDSIYSSVLDTGGFGVGRVRIDEFSYEETDVFSNLNSLDELDLNALKEASEKLEIINLVRKDLTGGWTKKNIDPVLDDLMINGFLKFRPSWRSVARWNSQYDSNKGLTSLVARNKFKKERKKPNKYDKADALIVQAINENSLLKNVQVFQQPISIILIWSR